ncbi:MAG: pyruvate, phosphate dikinase [Thermoanaerobaculia bacterium]|nr:pyruvate, phosphate dikinase [Thermoanaerobaculia bacterium]
MAERHVFGFGRGWADGDGEMKDVLGGKGAGLAAMARAGVPVPPGFTISTAVCNLYQRDGAVPAAVEAEIAAALAKVEAETGRRLGDPDDPLLLSVRSGARFSMPGMMNTILNLGLNERTVRGLIRRSGRPRFAWDCYRRFVHMFGEVALGIDGARFEALLSEQKRRAGVSLDTELSAEDLEAVTRAGLALVEELTGAPLPSDPREQLRRSRDAVFDSWWAPRAAYYRQMEKIPDDLGTAANVQAMVFGNLGPDSATGVGFTRDPATGEPVLYGEFLLDAQGEDVVSGARTPEPLARLAETLPAAHAELAATVRRLEGLLGDLQDFEFTVERGQLYLLQTRNGKRTGTAAVRIAVDLVAEGKIDEKTAVSRVSPEQLEQLLHPVFAPASLAALTPIARGIAASPGAAVGRAALSADAAVLAAKDGPVILVRPETTADDIHGMDAAVGILTAVGGASSHAAVVARGMGRPCVAGAGHLDAIAEGDWLSLDGTTGEVFRGRAETLPPDPRSPAFASLMAMADRIRGDFGVRANVDTPADARRARELGAEGIGLCRTEHMFFAEERVRHMRAMILADDEASRRAALARLLPLQRADFIGIFEAMDGLPVVIRTLDPPLHEFLPPRDELQLDVARLAHATPAERAELAARHGLSATELDLTLPALLARVSDLHEMNPMLGHRGCRLGISYPEITEMQVRAIAEAALEVTRGGGRPVPEIMIPLVGDVAELRHQRAIAERVIAEIESETGIALGVKIGTMIEIPRAALTADAIASAAEFFSFGTNDLTQTTYGMSRDDYGKFAPRYRELGIFKDDPFAVLDPEGVGRLLEMGVLRGRGARPGLEVGVCGEHGGEPRSIAFCHRIGLDYVSCSPYRVPIARLAAAQAVLAAAGESGGEARRTV